MRNLVRVGGDISGGAFESRQEGRQTPSVYSAETKIPEPKPQSAKDPLGLPRSSARPQTGPNSQRHSQKHHKHGQRANPTIERLFRREPSRSDQQNSAANIADVNTLHFGQL